MCLIVATTADGQGNGPANLHNLNESLIDQGQHLLKEVFSEWREQVELAVLLDLELTTTGGPQQSLLQKVKDVAKHSIKTSHPRLFNQQFAGVGYCAVNGRFLTKALNTYLYEIKPACSHKMVYLLLVCVFQGALPFPISCISGTMVQATFDQLDTIADMCEKHKLWMHVDAAWGGSVFFSKNLYFSIRRRQHFASWNPHKMLVAGPPCSALLLRDTTVWISSLKLATVLWSIRTAVGSLGLAARLHKAFINVRYAAVAKQIFVNLCFWFIPPSLRGKEGNTVDPAIKERKQLFLCVFFLSLLFSQKDLDFFLDEMEMIFYDLLKNLKIK
uniref:Uncharacterized protein n=1 Tax=Mola mola TaxID=94237 RepID=A0A3Q3W3V1_MOLML